MTIRVEFWNGHMNKSKKNDKYNFHVKTTHNPCLWSDHGVEDKPWRGVYKEAIEYIKQWDKEQINDTDFLHGLRYVAYGIGKRSYDDKEVVWPGNLTTSHEPKLVVDDGTSKYTIYFHYGTEWKTTKVDNDVDFIWAL